MIGSHSVRAKTLTCLLFSCWLLPIESVAGDEVMVSGGMIAGNRFLAKPVDPNEVIAYIDRHWK